ncbi:conserved protein of unknown function [Shewanella benthica]|uniref:Uncharacterized protein n=1 Tax=Shewanella benthica TaxID=43661 RepID=A0A330M4V9_9GAMM|nr:conserved protein of unknown function [Shewanella benthica]
MQWRFTCYFSLAVTYLPELTTLAPTAEYISTDFSEVNIWPSTYGRALLRRLLNRLDITNYRCYMPNLLGVEILIKITFNEFFK